MLPILRRNANLASAIAVLVEVKHAAFDPSRVAPVDGCTRAAGCLAATAVFSTIGLTGADLDNPGVCHCQEGDEGSDSSTGDLHFEDLEKSRESEEAILDEACGRLSGLIELYLKEGLLFQL